MGINEAFEKWAKGYSGCNGRDIGAPNRKSVWLCGVESGGVNDANQLATLFQQDVSKPPLGWDDNDAKQHGVNSAWEVNLSKSHIFFRKAMMLFAVILRQRGNNDPISNIEYRSFAEDSKPFVKGSYGYFSLNLLPINFSNLKNENWTLDHSKKIGFATKSEYMNWIIDNRFPAIKNWVETYQPKLVICIGKTKKDLFLKAFSEQNEYETHELIGHQVYSWKNDKTSTLIIVIPYLHRVSDSYIKEVGELIKSMLN